MPDRAAAAIDLHANAVETLPEGELDRRLDEGGELRVKLGIDPTAPDIHLGHAVVLSKLRDFQDLGHTVVLIVGDFTARVGDPSGRSSQRPLLEPAEIDANARTFQAQAQMILDPEKTEVRFNSEWLRMEPEALLGLMSGSTIARLLERDDFTNRMAAGTPISLLELLYPVLQGFDSVAIRSDVELGGTDQKFNLLYGRDLQASHGQRPQVVMTMPILPGTDGHLRMSKSSGNYIGVTDEPGEMFGKVMSLPDAVMPEYDRLILNREPDPELEPAKQKRSLARAIVSRFHDPDAATAAEAEFDRIFVRHEIPDDVEEAKIATGDPLHLPAALSEAFGISRGEARRLIAQRGVKIDGEIAGEDLDVPPALVDGRVISLGRRRHKRLRLTSSDEP